MDSSKKEQNIKNRNGQDFIVQKDAKSKTLIDLKVADKETETVELAKREKEVNRLITVTVELTRDGQIGINAFHHDKLPLGQDTVQDILSKAVKQLDYLTTVTLVQKIIQQMMNKKQVLKPGFRPSFWSKITGK